MYSITLTVSYVRSKDNYVADALSRMHDPAFLAQAIKLLAIYGINISHPGFNIWHHMSYNSWLFVFPQMSPTTKKPLIGKWGRITA